MSGVIQVSKALLNHDIINVKLSPCSLDLAERRLDAASEALRIAIGTYVKTQVDRKERSSP